MTSTDTAVLQPPRGVRLPGRTAGQPVRARGAVLGLVGIAVLLALGEVLPRSGVIPRDSPPTTVQIGRSLADQLTEETFWQAVAETVRVWLLGVLLASVGALVIGMAIGSVPLLRRATFLTVELLRPVPSVALLPLAVLLYGTTIRSTLLLMLYTCFWQVLLQVIAGAADVDPVARDTARSFAFTRAARLRHVVLPTLMPYFLTGLRLAATLGLAIAITVEMIIGSPGLGNEIAAAQSANQVGDTYALVVVAGVIGLLVNLGLRRAEKHVLRWHPSMRVAGR